MTVELYPHNQETYAKMTEMFKVSNRVGVVQPTGTGKSFLYLKWIEEHPQDSFAVLSPSNEIFTQLKEYATDSGNSKMLYSVQMISYQSLLRMMDAEIRDVRASKIVLDEFHRTGAEQWGPALLKLLDVNPEAQVLGASATPVRYLDDSKDMASELFDRNLAVEMSLGEAVRRGILPTPKYVPVWYDIGGNLEQYERNISKIKHKKERKALLEKLVLMKRRLENAYGAEKIFEKNMPHDHGKFIVFCRDKEHLDEMKKAIPLWLAGVNQNVRSYVSISALEDKDFQLQAFKDDEGKDAVKLLFTIDRLNEGVHVKGIDGVIMLRPTVSPIIYLQQMGRALSAGSEAPLIFDMVNNYQNVQVPMNDGALRNVFEAEFRASVRHDVEIGDFQIFEDMMEFTSLVAELEKSLFLSWDSIWFMHFQSYCRFKQEFGREPKYTETYEGVDLGKWSSHQRDAYKKGVLSEERKQQLLDAGFVVDVYETEWQKNYALYKEFKEKFGREPKRSLSYEGVDLGKWSSHQRDAYKKGVLSEERKQQLLNAGFVFDVFETEWQKNYALYKEFKEKFGREPKCSLSYEGVDLGAWVCNQRVAYKKGVLSEERKQQLLNAGFVFDLLEAEWQNTYALYKEFKEKFGREPKNREIYKEVALGQWIADQRKAFKKGTLSDGRKQQLLDAGFVVDVFEAAWYKNYALYKEFKTKFAREPKQREIYEGVALGQWMSEQRKDFKKGILSEEHRQQLTEVGFSFESGTRKGTKSLDDLISVVEDNCDFKDKIIDTNGDTEVIF